MTRKIICFLIVLLNVGILHAQQYSKVRVTLRDGVILEGKSGFISNESVSFTTGTTQQTYALYDVNLIQAKQGKATKWAIGCGGGCAALCIISGVVSGAEVLADYGAGWGTYALGSVLWVGIFAGTGALIGYLTDDYQTVYSGGMSSVLKNFKLNITSNQLAKYNLTLAYRFPPN